MEAFKPKIFLSLRQLHFVGRGAMNFAMNSTSLGVVCTIFALTVTVLSAEMPSFGESYAQGFTLLHFSREGISFPHSVRAQRVRADRCSAVIAGIQPCAEWQVMATTSRPPMCTVGPSWTTFSFLVPTLQVSIAPYMPVIDSPHPYESYDPKVQPRNGVRRS